MMFDWSRESFANFNVSTNRLEILLKYRFYFNGLGVGPESLLSLDRLPGAGPGTRLWVSKARGWFPWQMLSQKSCDKLSQLLPLEHCWAGCQVAHSFIPQIWVPPECQVLLKVPVTQKWTSKALLSWHSHSREAKSCLQLSPQSPRGLFFWCQYFISQLIRRKEKKYKGLQRSRIT